MAETMTVERMREVLTLWTEHTENLIEARTPGFDPSAPRNLVERAAAFRLALARLAALDAAREALAIVAAQINRASAQYDGDPADPAGNVSNLEMTSRECRAILAAYDQLKEPNG